MEASCKLTGLHVQCGRKSQRRLLSLIPVSSFFLPLPSTVYARKRVILDPAPATLPRTQDQPCRPSRSPRSLTCSEEPDKLLISMALTFSSVKTNDKRTIFGASMKETRRGLLFSVILLFREKSADKASLQRPALTSLTSVGPSSALGQRCHLSRRVSPAARLCENGVQGVWPPVSRPRLGVFKIVFFLVIFRC